MLTLRYEVDDNCEGPFTVRFIGWTDDLGDSYQFRVTAGGTDTIPITITNPDSNGFFNLPSVQVPRHGHATWEAVLENVAQTISAIVRFAVDPAGKEIVPVP